MPKLRSSKANLKSRTMYTNGVGPETKNWYLTPINVPTDRSELKYTESAHGEHIL